MVPTACHCLFGRRMLDGDKQLSASSLSWDFWLGRHGEAGVLKSLSAPGVTLPRPGFLGSEEPEGVGWLGQLLGWVGIEDLPQPHRRWGRITWGRAHSGGWLPPAALPGGHRGWSEIQAPESCATCLGDQSFPTQLCADVLLIMIMTLR